MDTTKTITIEQVCEASAEDEIRVIARGCSYFCAKNYPEIFHQLFLALYLLMEMKNQIHFRQRQRLLPQ